MPEPSDPSSSTASTRQIEVRATFEPDRSRTGGKNAPFQALCDSLGTRAFRFEHNAEGRESLDSVRQLLKPLLLEYISSPEADVQSLDHFRFAIVFSHGVRSLLENAQLIFDSTRYLEPSDNPQGPDVILVEVKVMRGHGYEDFPRDALCIHPFN